MNNREIKSRLFEIYSSSYIGHGTKAICYKKEDKVIKFYFYHYFQDQYMIEHLNKLIEFKNDILICPNEILVRNNRCLGYTMDYIDAPAIRKIDGNIYEIFNNFEKLALTIKDISDRGFVLNDLHYDNLLFDGNYYIIDLDSYELNSKSNYNIFNENMDALMETILYSVLGVNRLYKFSFYDSKYTKLRSKMKNDYRYFYDLIEMISKECNSEEISLIKRKTYLNCVVNSYYYRL